MKDRLHAKRGPAIPRAKAGRLDHYLTYSIYNTSIGSVNGLINVGSMAVNHYIANGNANIAGGTGTNQRIGNQMYWTTMRVRGCLSIPDATTTGRCRIIVAKLKDPTIGKLTTNQLLGAAIEGTMLLEPPQQQLGVVPPIDYTVSPTTECTVLFDKDYYALTATTAVPVEFSVNLAQTHGYDNASNPTEGSWFIYFVAPSGTTTNFSGSIKVEFGDII